MKCYKHPRRDAQGFIDYEFDTWCRPQRWGACKECLDKDKKKRQRKVNENKKSRRKFLMSLKEIEIKKAKESLIKKSIRFIFE